MKRFLSYYHPKLPIYLVYMLQQVDYEPDNFLEWLGRAPDLTKIIYRKTLVYTKKVKLLVGYNYVVSIVFLAISIDFARQNMAVGLILLLLVPFFVTSFFYTIVFLAWLIIEHPRRTQQINKSKQILKNHTAKKIAIAGSYGKTSMKEMLLTLIAPNKKITITPGNKNIALSHARWAEKLNGREEVLLIEYGEGQPDDIAKFAENTSPDIAIITGLAPNHLDKYESLESVADDLLSLSKYVDQNSFYINGDDQRLAEKAGMTTQKYSKNSVLGWKISNIKISINRTQFNMSKGPKKLSIHSELLGEHQVGPLAFAAALADKFGLSKNQIEQNIRQTKPYEHRMQPRNLHGAWIIDDTYNGSIEGFRAGLKLLKDLDAKRKIYVTPGLVDQGIETENVHKEIGKLITEANPNKVVLMQNSITEIVAKSLEENGYKGQVEVRDDPLEYYTNLEQTLAAGDLLLMQNDWTDNYN